MANATLVMKFVEKEKTVKAVQIRMVRPKQVEKTLTRLDSFD